MKKAFKENKLKTKQFFKENFKVILTISITAILVGGTTAFASYNYFAKDIEYKKNDGTKTSVESALNELYNKTNKIDVYRSGIIYTSSAGTFWTKEIDIDKNVKKLIIFIQECSGFGSSEPTITGKIIKDKKDNFLGDDFSRGEYDAKLWKYILELDGNSGKIKINCNVTGYSNHFANIIVIY